MKNCTVGIIFCRCEGRISGRLDLGRLAEYCGQLEEVAIVRTVNKLCGAEQVIIKDMAEQVDGLVIAACVEDGCVAGFRTSVEETRLPLFSCEFVNLRQECAGLSEGFAEPDLLARLMIRACVNKVIAGLELARRVVPVSLGAGTASPNEFLTRRQFFKMSFKLARYDEVPVIDSERCIAGRSACRVCTACCPTGALTRDDSGAVNLAGSKCQKCGLCTVLCPVKCLEMPAFSSSQAASMLTALADPESQLDDRSLIFTCDTGRNRIDRLIDGGWKMSGAFVIRVPCLASISPLTLLRALELGFNAVVLLCPSDGCRKLGAVEKWEEVYRSIQELCACLELPFRLKLLMNSDSEETAESVNRAFQDINRSFGPTRINPRPLTLDNDERGDLVNILGGLFQENQSRTIVNNTSLPFYSLHIARKQCSLCGVCARSCPSNALTITEGEESMLCFSHYDCLGCGTCLEKCAEKAITLEPVLDITRLTNRTHEIIARDVVARCRICNKPIANRSLIQSVEQRLRDGGLSMALENLYLCDTCKTPIISNTEP